MPKQSLQEDKFKYLECTNFTPGLNTLDDPIDLDPGESPNILNMDIAKKGKLISRFGYELITEIEDVNLRGIQPYYRTYNDNNSIDQSDDVNHVYANTYTPPVAISELAADKKSFTPSSTFKSRVYKIAVYVVSKGTGDWTLTLHDASNNLLNSATILNANLTDNAFNYFQVPYDWISGALHFHVTSTVADGTLKANTATDLSTASFIETYDSTGDYLIVHASDDNSYYITADDSTPVLIGVWGTDNGNPVRGTTFNNYAVFSDGSIGNDLKKWDATTLSNVGDNPPKSNIFAVFQKNLFVAGDKDATSKVGYTEPDSIDTGLGSNFINITVGDGWDVTALIPNNDFLQVYKTDTINGVNFSFDTDYNLTIPQQQPIINTQGGVWATDSVQAVYGYSYYMSTKGFEAYGPSPERVVADRPLPLSLEIEPTFKNINMQYKNAIVSAFFDNKYLCAAPLRPSRIANYVFVYNESVKRRFNRDNWTIYNDIPAAGFTKFRNSQKVDELYFISAYDGKIYKFNNTFSDNGNGYLQLWTSKTFKFGERTMFQYLDFEGVITYNMILNIQIVTDSVVATDTITKSNLITPTVKGNSVGGGYVGGDYVGEGFTGSAVPLYRFKKRIWLPQNVNYGYGMYFQLYSQQDSEGWGLSRYVLAYKQDPEDPTYERTN